MANNNPIPGNRPQYLDLLQVKDITRVVYPFPYPNLPTLVSIIAYLDILCPALSIMQMTAADFQEALKEQEDKGMHEDWFFVKHSMTMKQVVGHTWAYMGTGSGLIANRRGAEMVLDHIAKPVDDDVNHPGHQMLMEYITAKFSSFEREGYALNMLADSVNQDGSFIDWIERRVLSCIEVVSDIFRTMIETLNAGEKVKESIRTFATQHPADPEGSCVYEWKGNTYVKLSQESRVELANAGYKWVIMPVAPVDCANYHISPAAENATVLYPVATGMDVRHLHPMRVVSKEQYDSLVETCSDILYGAADRNMIITRDKISAINVAQTIQEMATNKEDK